MNFNPNELILEKVRSVEECDPATSEVIARYTQIEDASLKTSADGVTTTDAMGAEIATFYNAQSGTFSFSNSLFSLDLAASQFGSKKEIASTENKIIRPVAETLEIKSDHTVILKYVPSGTAGAEVKYVKVINDNNTFGQTFEASATAGAGKFTLDAETKTITLPNDVTGRVFVRYETETSNAVKITKRSDSVPGVKSLFINVLFHEPCNVNIVYDGVISVPRAQIDPSSVEIALKQGEKHAVAYKLQKNYCGGDDSKLFDIIVSED